MAFVRTINNEWDLRDEFKRFNRDYYSSYGYAWIMDYYGASKEYVELDVVGICCECGEYSRQEFVEEYNHELTFIDYLEQQGIIEDFCEEKGIQIEELELKDFDNFKEEYFDEYFEELVRMVGDNVYLKELDNGNIMIAE